jgi:hypothetical protein
VLVVPIDVVMHELTRKSLSMNSSARLIGTACLTLILTLVAVFGPEKQVMADSPTVIDLPAGLACSFPLRVVIVGSTQVAKEFTDKNGNPVRFLNAGKGSTLTFINLDTDATYEVKPNGSVWHRTQNPDGTLTWVNTGHNVISWFPTDTPAGPSTIQYIGRAVFIVDTNGNSTLTEVSGKTIDICAALS